MAWVVVRGRALGNHGKLKMSKKRKGVLHKDNLSSLAAAPLALPPPSCHMSFIIMLMETCITDSCSMAITKGFTWPSANPTRLWKNATELVQQQIFGFPFLALGFSQPGKICALSSSSPAGCSLSFLPKNCELGTSKINSGTGSFLNF